MKIVLILDDISRTIDVLVEGRVNNKRGPFKSDLDMYADLLSIARSWLPPEQLPEKSRESSRLRLRAPSEMDDSAIIFELDHHLVGWPSKETMSDRTKDLIKEYLNRRLERRPSIDTALMSAGIL